MLFIYNENRIEDGCWDLYRGYSSNDDILDNNYVKKSGDTMTGDLFIEKTGSEVFMNFQRTDLDMRLGTTDANGSVGGFHYYDSNGDLVMYLESKLLTGDKTRAQLYTRRTDASGTKYSHGFGIVIDGQGNGSVEFSSTAFRDAWADGMNVVKKAGDTMSGNLTISRATANSDTYFITTRTDTGVQVGFGVGSGGTNHGVYSYKLNKWLIYGDASKVYVSGMNFTDAASVRSSIGAVNRAGDTLTANFTLSASDTTGRWWKVKNSKHEGSFYVDSSGNLGIWSDSKGKWIIRSDASGNIYLNNHNLTNGIKGWTQIAQVKGTNSATYSLSGYTECLLMIWHGTNYFGTCVFPANAIGSTQYEMYTGGWGNKNTVSNRAGCAKVSNTKLTGVMVKVDNPDVTSDSYFRLYAR